MKPDRKSGGITPAGVGMAAAAAVLAAVAAALFAGPASALSQTEAEGVSRSVWSGVYTDAQARRGHGAYLDDCANCHGENLMGGDDAAPLAGEAFVSNWDGRTVGDLFDKVRLTMPDDDPGTLPKERVADIVAYLFSENGFPQGIRELAHETAPLKQIRIDAKQP